MQEDEAYLGRWLAFDDLYTVNLKPVIENYLPIGTDDYDTSILTNRESRDDL